MVVEVAVEKIPPPIACPPAAGEVCTPGVEAEAVLVETVEAEMVRFPPSAKMALPPAPPVPPIPPIPASPPGPPWATLPEKVQLESVEGEGDPAQTAPPCPRPPSAALCPAVASPPLPPKAWLVVKVQLEMEAAVS